MTTAIEQWNNLTAERDKYKQQVAVLLAALEEIRLMYDEQYGYADAGRVNRKVCAAIEKAR